MPTRTISAAGGNWSSTSTWEEGAVPTAADDVVARADGTSGNLTLNANGSCRSINLSNLAAGKTVTHLANVVLSVGDASGGECNLSGAWTYTAGNNWPTRIELKSTSNNGGAGWGFTSGGHTLASVDFNGAGGKWVLQDNLNQGAESLFRLQAGTVDANTKNITTGYLYLDTTSTRALNLSGSTITINGYGTNGAIYILSLANLTLNWGTKAIINSVNTSHLNLNVPSGTSLPDIEANLLSSNNYLSVGVNGPVTLSSLKVTAHSTGNLVRLYNNFTVTNELILVGISEANRLRLYSYSSPTTRTITLGEIGAGTQFFELDHVNFTKNSGADLNLDYIKLTSSTFASSGGVKGYAGFHSVDGGSNSGWEFATRESVTHDLKLIVSEIESIAQDLKLIVGGVEEITQDLRLVVSVHVPMPPSGGGGSSGGSGGGGEGGGQEQVTFDLKLVVTGGSRKYVVVNGAAIAATSKVVVGGVPLPVDRRYLVIGGVPIQV